MSMFEMSVSGAVLIAVILLLRRVLLCRLPKWTFLLLWGVALCRLLVPFRIPAPTSIYTGASQVVQQVQPLEAVPALETAPPAALPFPASPVSPPTAASGSVPGTETGSPIQVIYGTGAALCALFFTAAYIQSLRRFWGAVPAEDPWVLHWQKEHRTLLPIQIRVSSAVRAPLACGLLRPAVLLPQNTDWADRDQLVCVLTHEYVHIHRGDLLWKLLLTAALCLHWCNPLVWAMYFCANRDLELACDEAVIRILGLDRRKGYACSLLSAAEGGFSPLCTTFTTKSHMEERIRAIMNMKKQTLTALAAGVLLVAGITAVFATSQMPGPEELEQLPLAVPSAPPPLSAPKEDQDCPEPDSDAAGVIDAVPWQFDIGSSEEGGAVTGVLSSDKAPADLEPSAGTPIAPEAEHASSGLPLTAEWYTYPDGDTDNPELHTVSVSRDDPVTFWGLPDGPLPAGTVLNVHSEEEYLEAVRQLRIKGYGGSFILTAQLEDNRYIAVLERDYDGVQRELTPPEGILPDWTYPVNSRGESYGSLAACRLLGYEPDLEAVVASNGMTGYVPSQDLRYGGWRGEELDGDYYEWSMLQPKTIKHAVYDVEHTTVVGYYEQDNPNSAQYTMTQDQLDLILEHIEEHLIGRGCSQEEIARELEKIRQEHPIAPPEMTLNEKRAAYGW